MDITTIGNYGLPIAIESTRLSFCGKRKTDDIELLSRLVKSGDDHAKSLRGIVVYAEIDAPRYWWQEMATYRVGVEQLGSESTMHSNNNLLLDQLIEYKDSLAEGTNQRRIMMFNYQSLRRVYKQRRNHRLPQWRKFCRWIESLPYSDQLITVGIDPVKIDNELYRLYCE